MLRSLYNWVLQFAYKKYASAALFVLAFVESSFFPVPPDVLLMPMSLGRRAKAFLYAGLCTLGSVLGGMAGYAIGYWLWWDSGSFSALAEFAFSYIPGFTGEKFFRIQELYNRYDFWIIFSAGFTPLPYKIFTISAGAFDINFWMFLIASGLSRGARFFLVAGLLRYFGVGIQSFIDKYFNLLALLFTVLLVGGFFLLKVL